METQEIKKHIDRVVGTKGTLRIPSWWMHKILSDLVKYCEENELTSAFIREYVEPQLTNIDLSEYAKKDDIATINGQSITKGGNTVIQGASITPITYTDLMSLRDNEGLVAGTFYRIVDYITTTAQENTQSAGHPFDVIVLALSENSLAEEAYAIQSERDIDGYFANSNLSAWKLWYCLDNDTERFVWADAENGTGVIYRMIDEWENDVPYDFKNILFARYRLAGPYIYEAEGTDELWMEKLSEHIRTFIDDKERYSYLWAGLAHEEKYWEHYYETVSSAPTDEIAYFYTFSDMKDFKKDIVTDASFGSECCANIMGVVIQEGRFFLSNNIVLGNACRSNRFGNGCRDNTFGNDCYNNTFGNDCTSNIFGDYCYNNIFGNSCYDNEFGDYCYNNTLDDECCDITFCMNCGGNSLGTNCTFSLLGNGCSRNRFGNACYNNTFDKSCLGNNFCNGCESNIFGSNCHNNTLGNGCASNVLGDHCRDNTFGNGCLNNKFIDRDGVADHADNNKLDNGVADVELYYDGNNGSYSYLQNHHVCTGCYGTRIKIYNNRDYETTYARASSGEIKEFVLADLKAS